MISCSNCLQATKPVWKSPFSSSLLPKVYSEWRKTLAKKTRTKVPVCMTGKRSFWRATTKWILATACLPWKRSWKLLTTTQTTWKRATIRRSLLSIYPRSIYPRSRSCPKSFLSDLKEWCLLTWRKTFLMTTTTTATTWFARSTLSGQSATSKTWS